ncbi:MAG: RluA family pseudouridine synthase [Candidatus Acidiferrales bacterium]
MNPASAVSGQSENARESARIVKLSVVAGDADERLDRFLAAQLPELSRTRIQSLVDHGRVTVNGAPGKRSYRVESGDAVVLEIPAPSTAAAQPEAIPLEILYQDDDVAVVNKPAGMIVHPGAGAKSGTVVNALLHEFGARNELSSVGGELRPGIVHRLDRETSGALLIARNDLAHRALVGQFSSRQIEKTYVALLHGKLKEDSGRIELPVARDLHRRIRMTTRRREGRAARTDWRVRLRLPGYTLLEADLHTGRTHQIRVHFSALGHPVAGDTLYGAPRQPKIGSVLLAPLARNFLHAARIQFVHPTTGKAIEVRAPLPAELVDYLRELARVAGVQGAAVDAALKPYV